MGYLFYSNSIDQVVDIGENIEEIGDTLAESEQKREEDTNNNNKTTTKEQTAVPTAKQTKQTELRSKKKIIGTKLGFAAAKMGFGVVDVIRDNVDVELEGEQLEAMRDTAGK